MWFCANNNMGPCAEHNNDQFAVGQIHEGVAYWLSGWDSLAGFETHLSEGRMAGCRWNECYGAACAAGIDCSGFVSRCWEQTQKYYTYNLDQISTSYGSQVHGYLRQNMRAGDIFNNPSDHVVLLYNFDGNGDPIYYESTGSRRPYKVWLNIYDKWRLIDGWGTNWAARRYNNITDTTQIFLPYVVASDRQGDLNTHIRLRNPDTSGLPTNVTVEFRHSSGSVVGTASNISIQPQQVVELTPISYVSPSYYGQALSAVVYADQPLAVTAHLVDEFAYQRNGGYAGLVNGSDQVFFPLLKKNYNGVSSAITIQNIGRTAAQVSVTYYQSNGSGTWTESSVSIPVRGNRTFNLAPAPTGFIGSAVVRCTNNGQIVGAFCEQGGGMFLVDVGVDSENTKDRVYLPRVRWHGSPNAGGQARAPAQKAEAQAATLQLTPWVYLPLTLSYYPSINSLIQVQNAGARETTVRVTYRRTDGSGPWSEQRRLGAGRACTLRPPVPDNWIGSAVVESRAINGTAIEPLAVTVNEEGPAAYTSYTGLDRGAIQLYAPTVCHVSGWVSSIQVQNVDSELAPVYVCYYRDNGYPPAPPDHYHFANINPGQTWTFYQETIPDPFIGSATIFCSPYNRKLMVTVQVVYQNANNDRAWSYSLPMPYPGLYPIE